MLPCNNTANKSDSVGDINPIKVENGKNIKW